VCKTAQTGGLAGYYADRSMVESNNGEERLARIEHMLEQLQKESAAFQSATIALFDAVIKAMPSRGTAVSKSTPSGGRDKARTSSLERHARIVAWLPVNKKTLSRLRPS
jgi:hypothetical protein